MLSVTFANQQHRIVCVGSGVTLSPDPVLPLSGGVGPMKLGRLPPSRISTAELHRTKRLDVCFKFAATPRAGLSRLSARELLSFLPPDSVCLLDHHPCSHSTTSTSSPAGTSTFSQRERGLSATTIFCATSFARLFSATPCTRHQ